MQKLIVAAFLSVLPFVAHADAITRCIPDTPAKIEWKGSWYPGHILDGPDQAGRCLITYDGYDHSWDEWAKQSRLKPDGRVADSGVRCNKGAAVEIEWHGKWYAGQIDNGPDENNACHVHYNGYGNEWDEWAGQDRLRQPTGKGLSDRRTK